MSKKIIKLSKSQAVKMADSWFELASAEHFWLKHKLKVILKHFKTELSKAKNVAEVGCGNCLILSKLSRELKKPIDGIDLNEQALLKSPAFKGQLYLYNILEQNPKMQGKYDLLLLFDVLEHIKNEAPFLKALAWHLKPEGKLLLNVPATPALYSNYDKAMGHFRRYHIKTLLPLLESTGFTVSSFKNWGYSFLSIIALRKQILKLLPADDKNRLVKMGFKTNVFTNFILSLAALLDFQTSWSVPAASLLVLAIKK